MEAGDIAVPCWTEFIEQDLRDAIRKIDAIAQREAGQLDGDSNGALNGMFNPLPEPAVITPAQLQDKPKPKRRRSRSKKPKDQNGAKGASGKMKQYASAWVVFFDSKQQEARAANPQKSSAEIRKVLSKEWSNMSRFQRAPWHKEFENRKRLYELENPKPETLRNKSAQKKDTGGHTTKLSRPPMKHFETSRIEPLPYRPIWTKQKIYEDAYATPPTASTVPYGEVKRVYPRRRPNASSLAMVDANHDDQVKRDEILKVHALCEYCREMGFKGTRIMHSEADCRTKARHTRMQEAMAADPKRRERTPLTTFTRLTQRSTPKQNPKEVTKIIVSPVSSPEEGEIVALPPPSPHRHTVASVCNADLPNLANMDALLAMCGLNVPTTDWNF